MSSQPPTPDSSTPHRQLQLTPIQTLIERPKMTRRCLYCTKFSIEALVEQAKIDCEAHSFPQEAFYQHHKSFDDLEKSANDGCDFCQLILDSFRSTPCSKRQPLEWPAGWNDGPNSSVEGFPDTMYSIAKHLDVSDVKLCINATHLLERQCLKDVKVFDEILVQVGTLQVENDDNYGIWSFPQLRLKLSVPRKHPPYIGEIRIGRYEVDPDLGSPINHDLAKQWMSNCLQSHATCLLLQTHELPTRVIDVDSFLPKDAVRLVVSGGMKADYTALSHCWGGAISPLLTSQTMAPFLESIEIATLPANFRDAITITRNLGIRYLWIDSLCIQQDSKPDWEKESKKMGLVYRNSTVTISAMVSGGTQHGILNANQDRYTFNNFVCVPVFRSKDDPRQVTVSRSDPNEETLRTLDMSSALTERGWTLQEYILSPRHILYGKNMIYWRCPRGFISSDGLPPWNKFPQASYDHASQVIYSDIRRKSQVTLPDVDAILRDYYELVNAFSQRRLTYGSDKMPAFSGLAQRLHPTIGGDYLAGIWTTDFRRGLLWKSEADFCRHVTEPYRAPSWSWAVTDDMVLFEGPGLIGEESRLKSSPSSAELLEYSVNPRAPDNPYGEITSGTLVVKALTKPFVRSRQVIGNILDQSSLGKANFDEPSGPEDLIPMSWPSLFRMKTEEGDYILSIITRPGDETHWDVDVGLQLEDDLLLMLVYTDDNTTEEAVWSESPAFCLILRRRTEESEETYERIGFAKLDEPKLTWLETWERQILTLI